MSRAAHELASKADELIAEVKRCPRSEVPEPWDDPDLARMTGDVVGRGLGEWVPGAVRERVPGRPARRTKALPGAEYSAR
ncbi:hypothetical protein BIV23_02295 [Streptomyces monashensis]|uniref:Uncharacterized protein n=1 Tax=Streptomyces monashensis TaxID=1678012 RepID=A0A1S2QNU4_9ACTN|nr:hypothetical protein BIV23_02295 [Streptomyces monashensis]